jgi:hypothetical protein
MGSSTPAPTPYQPPNQAGAASAFQQGASQLSSQGNSLYNQANSGYSQLYNNALTNPYYAGAQANANATGQAGVNFGNQEVGWAQGLQGLASSLGQYQTGIAQTAYDPQNALYNRTQNQVTNQANAQAAASGLAGSPFGASLTNQANENFNIDWQNNQQQRQNAGVAALGSLDSTMSGLTTAAGTLGTSGLNTAAQSGQLANQVYGMNQQNIQNSLNELVGGDNAASSQQQTGAQDQMQYLQLGQTASKGALDAWQDQQQADAAFWGSIGKDATTAASFFI